MKRAGGVTKRPSRETRNVVNRKTGKIEKVPIGIDPGWDFNPGKDRSPSIPVNSGPPPAPRKPTPQSKPTKSGRPNLGGPVPEGYWDHPSAPKTSWDAKRLGELAVKASARKLPAKEQAELRQNLNSILASHGMVSSTTVGWANGRDRFNELDRLKQISKDTEATLKKAGKDVQKLERGTPEYVKANDKYRELGVELREAKRNVRMQEDTGSAKGYTAGEFVFEKSAGYRGMHEWGGRIHISKKFVTGEHINEALTSKSATVREKAAGGLRTLIHEGIHGHSPKQMRVTRTKEGTALEEGTTELAAHRVTEGLLGGRMRFDHNWGEVPGASRPPEANRTTSAYTGYVKAITEYVAWAEGISRAEAVQASRKAAIDMRKSAVDLPNDNAYVTHFLRQLPKTGKIVDRAMKAAAKEFDKKAARAAAEPEGDFAGRFYRGRNLTGPRDPEIADRRTEEVAFAGRQSVGKQHDQLLVDLGEADTW